MQLPLHTNHPRKLASLTYFLLSARTISCCHAQNAKQERKMSDENTTQRGPKGYDSSWNPLRFKKNQIETGECESQALRVEFEPDTKRPPTFVYSQETSEVATPVSAHTLKVLEAIREDKLEFVEEELSNMNKQDIDKTERHGFALIHVAARYNLHRIVKSLLEHGADVNIGTSEYRWTPLHLAARCVRIFLQKIKLFFVTKRLKSNPSKFSFLLVLVTMYPVQEKG